MPSLEQLRAQIYRLVHLTRTASLKRAIDGAKSDLHLNFWRVISGSQLDLAILEWCKVFGSHNEETHWKNVVPANEHASYKEGLLAELGITDDQWTDYWNQMKAYRDGFVAHQVERPNVDQYPELSLALASAAYHYKHLLPLLRQLDDRKFPDDLASYQRDFQRLASEVAAVALAATANIPETVR